MDFYGPLLHQVAEATAAGVAAATGIEVKFTVCQNLAQLPRAYSVILPL